MASRRPRRPEQPTPDIPTQVRDLYKGPLVNVRFPSNAGGTGGMLGSPDEMLRNLFMLLKKVKR